MFITKSDVGRKVRTNNGRIFEIIEYRDHAKRYPVIGRDVNDHTRLDSWTKEGINWVNASITGDDIESFVDGNINREDIKQFILEQLEAESNQSCGITVYDVLSALANRYDYKLNTVAVTKYKIEVQDK